jgi:pyruvate dehydrogenase E2 component (dihydrolipoamide acetyltransferase)
MSAFVMPSLGADMESAVLMEWKVKEGDPVKKGEVIAEVETSKGVIEIEVFETGVVEKILVEPETECKVGTPLAMIRADGEEEVSAPEKAAPEPERAEEEAAPEEPAPTSPPEAAAEVAKSPEERVKATPAARKRAAELGVALSALTPGAEGIIHLEEVEAASEKAPEKKKKEAPKEEGTPKEARKTEAPEKRAAQEEAMRQAIAAAMSRSNAQIPHYYLSTPIDMTAALEWLGKHNANRSIEQRILPAALLIRAAVSGLQEVPELNGFWEENGHRVSEEINPGIAIALRTGGLITPALLNAQKMGLEETMAALSDLITRTRSGRLRGAEMTQQTVTLTNLGDLGVERVYGVIYPPQVALVGLGRIAEAPWAEENALSVRKVLHASLAGDHRATDGRTGARFLERLNQILQVPEELL